MNYRDELLIKMEYHQSEHDRLENWVMNLDAAGFDWDNITDAQKWAIEHSTTKEVQQ